VEDGEKLLPVGYISRAHGIRGELVFVPDATLPEDPAGEIFLRPRMGGEARPFCVLACRRHHGRAILSLEGVNGRSAALALRAHTVLKPARVFAPGRPYPLAALEGVRVFVRENSGSERELGRILAAARPSGQTLWTIKDATGREFLFPAVDQFILSLDLENGMARIAPPPGLLETCSLPGPG
jgi:16S rRNA processing protein RimM